jgi:hypothetical protein
MQWVAVCACFGVTAPYTVLLNGCAGAGLGVATDVAVTPTCEADRSGTAASSHMGRRLVGVL